MTTAIRCECPSEQPHPPGQFMRSWLTPAELAASLHLPGECPGAPAQRYQQFGYDLALCSACRTYGTPRPQYDGATRGTSVMTLFKRSGGAGMSREQLARLQQSLQRSIRQVERLKGSTWPPKVAHASRALLARVEDVMATGKSTALTVATRGDVTEYSHEEIAIIKQTVAPNLTDAELQAFLAMAQHNDLDPFNREVYAVKYSGRMTLITGIDGYRKRAASSGQYAGTDEIEFGPDVPDAAVTGGKRPEWARCTVYLMVQGQRLPATATCRWEEFAKRNNNGYTDFWRSSPYNQLGKCAEGQALRKGFPRQIGQLRMEVAPHQAVNFDAPPNVDPATGEIVEGTWEEKAPPARTTPTWQDELRILMEERDWQVGDLVMWCRENGHLRDGRIQESALAAFAALSELPF